MSARFLARVPLWVYPLALALIFFLPARAIPTGADSWRYLSAALNIVHGHGYSEMNWEPSVFRAPGYCAWLAAWFRMFGATLFSGYVATRVLTVLSVLVIYSYARRLFGSVVALLASLLILGSSWLATESTEIKLDYLFPTSLFLTLVALEWALAKPGRVGRATLAGACLAAAYWIKETAILFAPLPFLMTVFEARLRSRKGLLTSGIVLAAFALGVLPWAVHVATLTGSFNLLGSNVGPSAARTVIGAVQQEPAEVFLALWRFYWTMLSPIFGLAPLMALGWIFVGAAAIHGDPGCRRLTLAVFCFLPLVVFQGIAGDRPGQSIFFFLASMIGVAWLVVRMGERVAEFRRFGSRRSIQLVTVLAMIVLGAQFFLEHGGWLKFARDQNPVDGLAALKSDLPPSHWGGSRVVANWLRAHAREGMPLLTELPFSGAIYFLSGGENPLYWMPWRQTIFEPYDENAAHTWTVKAAEPPLFLVPKLVNGRPIPGMPVLQGLTQADLLDAIEGAGVGYVVVSRPRGFESLYFDRQPGIQRVATWPNGFVIYKVVAPCEPIPFPVLVDEGVPAVLDMIEKRWPQEYRSIEAALHTEFGMTAEELSASASDAGRVIETYHTYPPGSPLPTGKVRRPAGG